MAHFGKKKKTQQKLMDSVQKPRLRAPRRAAHPVEGVMMQPPRSAVTRQPHPRSGVSWFMPKLWPSSWASVTAAPRGLSE